MYTYNVLFELKTKQNIVFRDLVQYDCTVKLCTHRNICVYNILYSIY